MVTIMNWQSNPSKDGKCLWFVNEYCSVDVGNHTYCFENGEIIRYQSSGEQVVITFF
jgi:hypothetical protein